MRDKKKTSNGGKLGALLKKSRTWGEKEKRIVKGKISQLQKNWKGSGDLKDYVGQKNLKRRGPLGTG